MRQDCFTSLRLQPFDPFFFELSASAHLTLFVFLPPRLFVGTSRAGSTKPPGIVLMEWSGVCFNFIRSAKHQTGGLEISTIDREK